MQFIIMRRKSAKAEFKPTSHVIEADSVNAALRKFGLRGAYASPDVRIAEGGKTGRQYTAVSVTDSAKTVKPETAPVAAAAVKVNGKRTVKSAEPTVTDNDAPFGYKADGTPRKRPVPTWLIGNKKEELTVKSNHSDSKRKPRKRGGAQKVHRMTMAERRDARLADARAQAAADRQAKRGRTGKSLTQQERDALGLLSRLDNLKAEVERMGIKL